MANHVKQRRASSSIGQGKKELASTVTSAREHFTGLSRTSFAINYTLTLMTVAILLVTTFASLEAQESTNSLSATKASSQTKATKTTPAASASPTTDRESSSSSSLSPSVTSSTTPSSASSKSTIADPSGGSSSTSTTLTASESSSSTARQPRATTTKKHSSTTSTAASTDSDNSTTSSPDSDVASEEVAERPAPAKRRQQTTTAASKATTKKKPTPPPVAVQDEETASDEEASAQTEEPAEEVDKVAKKKKKVPPAVKHGKAGGTTARQPLSGAAPTSTTTEASSTTSKPTEGGAGATTARKRKPTADPSSLSSTAATTTTKKKTTTPPASTESGGEDYDDDASGQEREEPTTHKPVDISKIKPVGLNQWNESIALNQSATAAATASAQASTTPKTHSKTSEAITLPSAPSKSSDDQSAEQPQSVSSEKKESGPSGSPASGSLDPRSPSAQQASSIARRITGILTDSKNKLSRPAATTTTTSSGSTAPKFAYSKPFSATTMMTPSAGSNEGKLVQVVNRTDAANATSDGNFNLSIPQDGLDWSKLVKIVFKSAKDNRTIYTVIMNSSELSNHPINDWSSELPNLLQRDFEKLIQKWSNVLPLDHLMSDLGKIIISKVNDTSPGGHGNVSAATTMMMNKLNSSLANNLGATKPALKTVIPAAGLSNLTSMTSPTSPSPSISHSSSTKPPPATLNTTFSIANTTGSPPEPTSKASIPLNVGSFSLNHTTTLSPPPGTNSSLTQSSPKSLNVSLDYLKSTTPWSSSLDLATLSSATPKRAGAQNMPNMQAGGSFKSPSNGSSATFITAGGSTMPPLTAGNNQRQHKLGANRTRLTQPADDSSQEGDRSIVEMIKDMNEEHSKIEDNVKDQADSLRHFIIICSIAVVLATSLAVGLIVFLIK